MASARKVSRSAGEELVPETASAARPRLDVQASSDIDLPNAALRGGPMSRGDALRLQGTIGNRATSRLLGDTASRTPALATGTAHGAETAVQRIGIPGLGGFGKAAAKPAASPKPAAAKPPAPAPAMSEDWDDTDEAVITQHMLPDDDAQAAALAAQSKREAMGVYLESMKAAPGDANALKMVTQKTRAEALPQAEALAAGRTGAGPGADQAALAVAQQRGLSEAEIAAIKTYTSDDFGYINPSAANDPNWLKAKNPQAAADPKAAMQEGALQAGATMEGLAKLPPVQTTGFRGMGLSEDRFRSLFVGAQTWGVSAFTSFSTVQGVAEGFRDSSGDPVKVLMVAGVTNGRDIAALSVYGQGEAEVLVLPGASFAIQSITPTPPTDPSVPLAGTGPYTVTLTQTK